VATRRQTGQGLVEFALVLPIILLGFLISVDFGRVIYAQNVISQNAVNAARSASAPDFCSPPSCNNDIQEDAKVRQVARTLSPLVAVPDCAINGEAADPHCSDHLAGGAFLSGDGTRIVVEIVIPVPLLTPIISNIVGGSITVRARAEELLKG
jgi:hypothetical protein